PTLGVVLISPRTGCGSTAYCPAGTASWNLPFTSVVIWATTAPVPSRIRMVAPATGRSLQAGSPGFTTGHVGPASAWPAIPGPAGRLPPAPAPPPELTPGGTARPVSRSRVTVPSAVTM